MFIVKKIKNKYNSYKKSWMEKHAYEREITDISGLNYPFCNIPTIDRIGGGGESYGHAYNIKKYSGLPESVSLNCAIEHGLNITSRMICEIHASYPVKYILTFSRYRKEVIEEITNMEAIPIGPYIAYADDYRNDEYINNMKNEFGKILLVFPTHGTVGVDTHYDINEFADEIDRVSHNFDTVFVSLSAYDINSGMARFYQKRGYIIVSSGVTSDKYFLSRQRMIFRLSDAVCGHSFTTGLSYALYFNKPIYLFRQSIKYNAKRNNVIQLDSFDSIVDELFDVCNDPNFNNLKEQQEWSDYYFGLNDVKRPDEMQSILSKMVR